MALHTLHTQHRFEDCLQTLEANDVLILLDQAIYLSPEKLALPPCPVFALEEELAMAGVLPLPVVTAMSYEAWVRLSESHPQQLVWY